MRDKKTRDEGLNEKGTFKNSDINGDETRITVFWILETDNKEGIRRIQLD